MLFRFKDKPWYACIGSKVLSRLFEEYQWLKTGIVFTKVADWRPTVKTKQHVQYKGTLGGGA